MKEYLRFACAYWHSFCGNGADPFGEPTHLFSWNEKTDAVERAKDKALEKVKERKEAAEEETEETKKQKAKEKAREKVKEKKNAASTQGSN